MLAFVVRRLISMVFVLLAISFLTYVIFFATPGVDPAARIAGRSATPATLAVVRHEFGLDRPFPIQYALMMKKLFITRDLTSFVNRGNLVIPQITRRRAGDALAGVRRGRPLGGDGHSHGAGRGGVPRHVHRPHADDHRPDRHLDAGLLARRGRQPDHAEPPARLRLLMGAATRLHAPHRWTRGCGSSS